MTKLVTSGSVGGMASNGCLYPEGDAEHDESLVESEEKAVSRRRVSQKSPLPPEGVVKVPSPPGGCRKRSFPGWGR